MPPPARHAPTGKFASGYDPEALLEIAAEVLRVLPDPVRAKQADFNAALSDAYPDAPPASQICTRLGISWRELKHKSVGRRQPHERVDTPKGNRDRGLARVTRKPLTKTRMPSSQEVTVALRWAALRNDDESHPQRSYLRAYHDAPPEQREQVPTLRQMYESLARDGLTWAAGLERAGLSADGRWRGRRRGLSWDDALTMYVDDRGEVPTRADLMRWTRRRALMLASQDGKFLQIVARVRDQREQLELPWPEYTGVPADLSDVEPVAPDHPYVNRALPNTVEGIVDGLVAALDALEPGRRLNEERLLLLWERQPLGIPNPQWVHWVGRRHGIKAPFTTLRARAVRQRHGRDLTASVHTANDPSLEAELREYLTGKGTWPSGRQWKADKKMRLLQRARARGVLSWCSELGVQPPQRNRPTYTEQELEQLLREYLVDRYDTWPGPRQFEADGKLDLYRAACTGSAALGAPTWAKRLGLTRMHKVREWNDTTIEQALRPLIGPNGEWPTAAAFQANGLRGLYETLRSTGTIDEWIRRMGAHRAGRSR